MLDLLSKYAETKGYQIDQDEDPHEKFYGLDIVIQDIANDQKGAVETVCDNNPNQMAVMDLFDLGVRGRINWFFRNFDRTEGNQCRK